MRNFKRKGYFLLGLLVTVAILIGSIQSISARMTGLVGNLEGSAALLPTGQVITPVAAPGSPRHWLARRR